MLKKEEFISVIDEGDIPVEYQVDKIWNDEQLIDFIATKTEPFYDESSGQYLYKTRGFSFKDEGLTWIKLN